MITPLGDTSRIHGAKVALDTSFPMLSTIASPFVAVNDHGSTSPTLMVPAWLAPLVSGPPPRTVKAALVALRRPVAAAPSV